MSIKVVKSTGEVFLRDTAGQEVRVRVIGDSVIIGKLILDLHELKEAIQASENIWQGRSLSTNRRTI